MRATLAVIDRAGGTVQVGVHDDKVDLRVYSPVSMLCLASVLLSPADAASLIDALTGGACIAEEWHPELHNYGQGERVELVPDIPIPAFLRGAS